jgi:hypothetical protein
LEISSSLYGSRGMRVVMVEVVGGGEEEGDVGELYVEHQDSA